MPTNYKILGQAAPANTNNTNLYTVPASTQSVTSTIAIANTTLLSATARIFVRAGGTNPVTGNAIVYDTAVPGNSVITLTLGITLSAGDILTVQSGTANALTFHAFGNEIS
jgi:hypothetical protein